MSMLVDWKHATKSSTFNLYLFINLLGLLMSILAITFWKSTNAYSITLFTYALGILFPLGLDIISDTPQLPRVQKNEAYLFSILIAFTAFLLPSSSDFWSVILTLLIVSATLYIWGGTYAYDPKMNVAFPTRSTFTNDAASDQRLSAASGERDVDI